MQIAACQRACVRRACAANARLLVWVCARFFIPLDDVVVGLSSSVVWWNFIVNDSDVDGELCR